MTRRSVLAAVVGALIAAGGCARGAQPVASPQPFRDEHDPGDEFQFTESAVPAEEEAKSDPADDTTETTIEIDVDEESESTSSTDDASTDDSSSEDSSGDEDVSGDVGDDALDSRSPSG